MAGYSGTPLAKKLGIKPGQRVAAPGAPAGYPAWIAPLPDGVTLGAKPGKTSDLVHLFTKSKVELTKALASYRKLLAPEAAVWVSWPKKASKVPTDITEDVIRAIALPLGFVDIKVCAVNETWSGLKLVVRKGLR